jgi:hypothetical protein
MKRPHHLGTKGGQIVGLSAGDQGVRAIGTDMDFLVDPIAPALRISVFRLGHEVNVRPCTRSPSTSVQGPWQTTAAGFPASNIDRTNCTAAGIVRNWSGLATPPGRIKPA